MRDLERDQRKDKDGLESTLRSSTGAQECKQGQDDENSADEEDSAPKTLKQETDITGTMEDFVGVSDMEDSDMDVDNENGSDGESDLEDDQLGFVHRQPLVGKGMAATLALLKGSGELKKTEQLAGRAKDSRAYDPSSTDHGVKLEYRDEFGRKLTQKEAFRQLSYKFHGYGPSQKKKEKRLKVSFSIITFL